MTKKFLVDKWLQGSRQLRRCAGSRLEFDPGQDLFLKTKSLTFRTKPLKCLSNRDINKRQQRIKGLLSLGSSCCKFGRSCSLLAQSCCQGKHRITSHHITSHHRSGHGWKAWVLDNPHSCKSASSLSGVLNITCKLSIAAVTWPASLLTPQGPERKKLFHFRCSGKGRNRMEEISPGRGCGVGEEVPSVCPIVTQRSVRSVKENL